MKRVMVVSIVWLGFAAMLGCGGSKTPIPSNVTVSPKTASAKTGQQVQFTATVTSGTNSGFLWQVNGSYGGDLNNGTIDGTGLYTAPGTVPKKPTVTITAVSIADNTQTASAQLTLSAGTPVKISVSPSTASVPTSQTVQFSATVENTANASVAWAVNDTYGGSATTGYISSTGVFTAPASVPTTPTVTIKAVATADSNATATAQVTITPFTYITVSPTTVVLPAGGQQAFAATINGQNATATWSVSCQAQAPGDCGSVDAAGLYTAPAAPPPGGQVVVTATSDNKDIHAGGATVTVQFSNASLNGHYAFAMSGQNASTPVGSAGSVTFDGATDNQGNGSLTGGVIDVHASGFSTLNITGGTYRIGNDGRGTATVNTSDGATATWHIALVNHSHGFAVSSGDVNTTASGTLDLQDATQFDSASVQGSYALTAGGTGSLGMAGALRANGSGGITAGLLDVNSAGTVHANMAATGSYTAPSSSGRGTLTVNSSFGAQNFAYYIVDAAHVKLIRSDAGEALLGTLAKQSAGPFTEASFAGGFAFVLTGSASGQALGEGGVLTLDGSGHVSSGNMDINRGSWQSGLALSGTYNITDAANGRATLTLDAGGSTLHYVIYPQSGGVISMLHVDADAAAGNGFAQSDSSYTVASIKGKFALGLTSGQYGVAGLAMPNGGGAMAGTLDINDFGTVSAGVAMNGSYRLTAANGRGTASMQTSVAGFRTPGFGLYVVDPGKVLFLASDPAQVLTGVAQQQY